MRTPIQQVLKTLCYKKDGRSARLMKGFLHWIKQPLKTRLHPLSKYPISWSDCCLWMHAQAQGKTFRLRWGQLAQKYPKMDQVQFVRIAQRGGLSPSPSITWQWKKDVAPKTLLS